jgi:GntR family transcriptional regulator, transcriptional repressor for pyruvate dehydrogenase complex
VEVSATNERIDPTPMTAPDFGSVAAVRTEMGKLSDRVAIELGTRIVTGDIAPDTRLPTEAELCERFSVSRSVIRDAMRTLAARDLIEIRQGYGMVTSQPSDVSFSEALIILLMRSEVSVGDVRELRVAIETELAPLAAERGTKQDWKRLRARLEGYSRAVDAKDWPAAQERHLDFHYSLFSATQLPALSVLLKPMQQIILLSSLPPGYAERDPSSVWTEADVQTHYPILEALIARDREAVRQAMQTHFSHAGESRSSGDNSSMRLRDSETAQALLRDLLTA